MKLLVREIQRHSPYTHTRLWIVDLDQSSNQTSWNYRARSSANAFFYGSKKRNYTDDFVYTCSPLSEAVLFDETIDPDNEQQVSSLWDFYKIIGYNYRLKKISDSTPVV